MKQHLHTRWTLKNEETFVLNLDEAFSPFANTSGLFFLTFKKLSFPGGEPHFQITSEVALNNPGDLIITHRVNNAGDFMDIILAVDAARRAGFTNLQLVLPYFPAARQDRVCNAGEPLTVAVFAKLINDCNFSKVFIFTPHSEVTPALLNNVVVVDDHDYATRIVRDMVDADATIKKINIVCPDAGAGKRVGKIATHLASQFPLIEFEMIRCEKIRDVKDGSLKEFFVQADDLGGNPSIILDDVVAYGGTFLGLADKLIDKNCGKLVIFTAHADCQAGIDNLASKFNLVYTTNSKRDYAVADNVKIIPFTI
jgi:ribose-phosphate pyrophosphokinase